MKKSGSLRNSVLNFLLVLFSLSTNESLFSQVEPAPVENSKYRVHLSASFQYRNLPNEWDIMYYGLLPEFYLSDKFSVSGPFYAGKGSDNLTYIHLPIGGIFIAIATWSYFHLIIDESDLYYYSGFLKFLLAEKINYNVRANDKLTVSPYLSILGLDASETYGSPDYQNALLSNGLGLNVKVLFAKHLTFCSSLELKHFNVTGRTFNSKNYIGYTVGINLGYIFE